ncbi:MAG: FRG domain-containing protein [Clostridium sp.]|nr:FRG domain-containing protein [Clostridium sp.]
MDFNQEYEINSLSDYMNGIKAFSAGDILWYRGHASHKYQLLPNLYRGSVVDFPPDGGRYNSIHLAEDMRIQQYYATNYSFIKGSGINSTEWLGMAQHFGLKTRFLDWSTSALHALMFALESFADPKTAAGRTKIPCVWVLKPQKMNKRIVDELIRQSDSLYDQVKRTAQSSESKENKESKEGKEGFETPSELIRKLKPDSNGKSAYDYIFKESNPKNQWGKMDYLYDLAYFDRLLNRVKNNPELAFTGDVVNPIFYFLACIYIEGLKADKCLGCTPLAIIHPINSERIKEQRGVFTVFPFPHKASAGADDAKDAYDEKRGFEYMRMEYNSYITGCLCKLVIKRPKQVLKELQSLGVNRSWLYFEPDKITAEIEG